MNHDKNFDGVFLDTFGSPFPGNANALDLPRLRFELASGSDGKQLETAVRRCEELFRGAFAAEETVWLQLYFDGTKDSRTQLDMLESHGLKPHGRSEWRHSRERSRLGEGDQAQDRFSVMLPTHSPGLQALITAIVRADHGGWQSLHFRALIFSPSLCLGFYPYDDRGLDIFARRAESLQSLYQRQSDWILDHDRPRILKELGRIGMD